MCNPKLDGRTNIPSVLVCCSSVETKKFSAANWFKDDLRAFDVLVVSRLVCVFLFGVHCFHTTMKPCGVGERSAR